MSWSFKEYILAEVKDMTLPCVVKIAEGYHGEGESESFSRDDIIKIDEFAVLQKVVANFVSDYQGNKAFYQDEIQIPLNYNGKLKVIHPPKEYSTVAELSENPPRYAKILEPAKTPIAYKGGGTVIPPGTIIEIDRVLPKIKDNEKTLLVTVNKNTIQLPLSLKLKASAVPDENEYTMKEVIDRFGLPRTIKFLDNKVQEVFERNLRVGVENMSRITGTLRLKRLVKQKVLIGHYKGLEYSDEASTTTIRRSAVVIPLAEFAETLVQIREEENHHDYEIFVASNFSQCHGCKFVDGSLYAEFTRKPTVYKIPEEIEEATEEEKTKDASPDYEERGPPRHRPPPSLTSLPPRPGNQNVASASPYRNRQGATLTNQTPTQSTRGQTHEQPRRPLPTPHRPTPNTPTSPLPWKYTTVPPPVPLRHRHKGGHQSIKRFDIPPKPHNLTPLQNQTKDTDNDDVYECMAPMAGYVKLHQHRTPEFALSPRTKASVEDSYISTPGTGKGYDAKSVGGKFVSWFQKKPKSKDPKPGKRHVSFDDECKTTADTTDENDDYELPVVKGTEDDSDDEHHNDEPEELSALIAYRQKTHRPPVNVEDDTDPHHPISNIPMATVQLPVPNAHTHMGGKVKTVEELSVIELKERLELCGLEKFAEVCKEQKLDGNVLVMLDKDMLKSAPFSLTDFEICKLERMITKNWIPIEEEERREKQERTMKVSAEPLLLLYAELKDKLRRDQCRVIAKDIAAEKPLPAEEKASFQEMTKRRDLVDWLLKYVLSQKDEMILKIFCESLGKQSPSLGQTLHNTSVQKHELVKTERQTTTLQLDDLHFLQRSFNSKLVVDIIIDKLLSRLLITVEEHSSIRSSSDESEMTKRLEALLQYDTEITQQFKKITQPFRNASVSQTADWLVPLHAQAKETLSCGKGLAIATDIFQQVPGIISRTDFYELFKLKDSSRDVIDRLLKHIYRQPRPEVFDVICYSLKEHDEGLYEHFLRMFFFKGADKEKARPVVNRDSALPSGRGADYLYNIIRNRQTLDVVIDHLLSSFCITVDQHSDIRNDDSINWSIKKLVELLEQSPQTIVAVNAILRHLDKIADTKNIGDKEITISFDFGDLEVNSQTKNYMDSLCGQTLPLPDIGQFYLNDVKDGSVVIKISPLDRESLSRFRDMVTKGTILEYLRDHIKVFLPDDVEIALSELSIGVIERTTSVPVQSANIINATIDILSVEVYKMENEPFVQPSFLHQKYSKFIGSIRMFPEELLSQNTESNSSDRGLVCAGQLGSNGEPLAIKQMLLGSFSESLETYKTVKERLQHRNIVKIFCVEKDEKYGYVAMERMDENLDEYVARSCQHGHTDMDTTEEEIYYMKRIVTGLAFIHEKGCLHNMLSPRAILLKKNNPDTLPKQVSIACFSYAALGKHVPVSCKKGTNDVLALIKVLLFVLYKKEKIVNVVIQADNRIIQSGHFDIFILLQDMLNSRTSDELKLQEFALHPALSSPIVQLDFLKVSDRLRKKLRVDFNLTNRMNRMKPWLYEPTLTGIVYQYLKDVSHCKYKPHSLNSLVRCIRNCHEHLSDIMLQVQQEIGAEERYIYYWLVKFPGLVSSVYEAMRPHKNHTALRKFFIID